MNSKIALILAIILGAFAAITVKVYIAKVETSAKDKNSLRQIIVAKTSLKAGQLLKETDIGTRPIETDLFDNFGGRQIRVPAFSDKRVGLRNPERTDFIEFRDVTGNFAHVFFVKAIQKRRERFL